MSTTMASTLVLAGLRTAGSYKILFWMMDCLRSYTNSDCKLVKIMKNKSLPAFVNVCSFSRRFTFAATCIVLFWCSILLGRIQWIFSGHQRGKIGQVAFNFVFLKYSVFLFSQINHFKMKMFIILLYAVEIVEFFIVIRSIYHYDFMIMSITFVDMLSRVYFIIVIRSLYYQIKKTPKNFKKEIKETPV